MSILVTGGAGYIGSVVTEDLRTAGRRVCVVDNLVYGHREAVDPSVPFYQGSIGDGSLIESLVDAESVDAVMHFSAFAYVGESVEDPGKYFENNFSQTLSLLNSLIRRGVKRFIFSSTCATYGEPEYTPIDEKHPQNPTNPYGWSKYFVERMLESFDSAHGLKFVALRYFNAAGATAQRGEDHDPETHLVPLVLDAAVGKRESITVFGNDYPTRDGTAVRDYIHVSDLSRAHLLALEYLENGGASDFFNLGNGSGYTVNEVIDAAREVTGEEIKAVNGDRRPGDPSELIADASRAREVLGWSPSIGSIREIIDSAWKWRTNNPEGYRN